MRNTQVLNCPSTQANDQARYEFADGEKWGSYVANTAYWGPDNQTDNLNGAFSVYRETAPGTFLRMRRINLALNQVPAGSVMVTESRLGTQDIVYAMGWDTGATTLTFRDLGVDAAERSSRTLVNTTSSCCAIAERHLSRTNVLYTDGHVKATNLDDLSETKVVPVSVNGGAPTDRNIYTA